MCILIKNRKDLTNCTDMLDGNICRMCVTSDIPELVKMYYVAKSRLDDIYSYNLQRIKML